MKDHLKLLTPEIRKKVEDKMKACFKAAEKHYGVKFEFPEIRYDIKSWTGGLAYRDRNLVRYNLILMVENEKHYLDSTVPHETAHMIVNGLFRSGKFKLAAGKKKWMPHGKEWKEVMGVLKVAPEVRHSYDCSSIEKVARARRLGKTNRLDRILKQVLRLSQEERTILQEQIDAI
jgi:SprT protein